MCFSFENSSSFRSAFLYYSTRAHHNYDWEVSYYLQFDSSGPKWHVRHSNFLVLHVLFVRPFFIIPLGRTIITTGRFRIIYSLTQAGRNGTFATPTFLAFTLDPEALNKKAKERGRGRACDGGVGNLTFMRVGQSQ